MKVSELLFCVGSFVGGPVAGFWFWGPFENLLFTLLAIPLYAVFPGIVIGALLSLPVVAIKWRIDAREEQEWQRQQDLKEEDLWRRKEEHRREEKIRTQNPQQREEWLLRQKNLEAEQRHLELESMYNSITVHFIESGEPFEGMKPDMVEKMWGSPHKIQEEKLKTKRKETWTWYENPEATKKKISKKAIFADGALTAWEIRPRSTGTMSS